MSEEDYKLMKAVEEAQKADKDEDKKDDKKDKKDKKDENGVATFIRTQNLRPFVTKQIS